MIPRRTPIPLMHSLITTCRLIRSGLFVGTWRLRGLRSPVRLHGLLGLAAWIQALHGQVLITRWDFNGGTLAPASGMGEARSIGGTSSTFAAGRGGETSGGWNLKGFPTQGTLPGTAGVEFELPTVGLGPVGLAFQVRHSNTSANTERVLWSADGAQFAEAGRFTVVPAASGTGETWYDRSITLPTESANPSRLWVRIVSDFGSDGGYLASRLGSNYSPSGTWRLDNVSFSAVPEPSEYAAISAFALAGFALWRRGRRSRKEAGEAAQEEQAT